MNKQKLFCIVVTAITAVALISYAVYLLVGLNPDVLITAQDRNVFIKDAGFFCEQIMRPFGLFQYVGAYLTQFFYYPALGSAILIGIWSAIAFVGIKAFRLKGLWQSLMIVVVACLLASILDLGYWVYCLNLSGYWFSQSIGILSVLLLLFVAHSTPRKFRLVWYVLVGFVLFPLFGWASYLFTSCLAISQLSVEDKKWTFPSLIDVIGIVLTYAAPFVFTPLLYDGLQSFEVTNAGFPFFKTATDESLRPTIPFLYAIGTMAFASLGRVLPAFKKIPACLAYAVVGVASAYVVWTTIFKDENYHYEIQMTQATMVDDWEKVISVAEKTRKPSRTMVMLKNIALLNTNQLGERSYELGNDGMEIYNPDSLNINIMHIASPTIYYNHGLVNYAMRWCMEFAVPYGFSPYQLKNMARSAMATGEKQLAKRYIDRLHKMTFYKDWQPAPVSDIVKELQTIDPDVLDNDNNSVERYIISRFSTHHYIHSPHFCELSLLYATIVRDPNNFNAAFFDYLNLHKGNIPKHYQEAFCLFSERTNAEYPMEVKIEPEIYANYKKFLSEGDGLSKIGMTEAGFREAMRDDWSRTYWWFNAFGRQDY